MADDARAADPDIISSKLSGWPLCLSVEYGSKAKTDREVAETFGKEDEKALSRYEVIAPLLSDGIEGGERRRLRAKILVQTGISDRTLRRHIANYRKDGLGGLSDATRSDKGVSKSIPEAVINEAVRLREEMPERSARQIIEILVGEKWVKPGAIARTTLNEKLVERGAGSKHLKAVTRTSPARRFVREHRNNLWQLDIKNGPVIGGKGRSTKTYMLAIIDDATRMIMHAEFYAGQKLPILEDAFRKALLKYGKPDDVLVDNGKIFVSKWFRVACARLGIRHIAAKPYSPQTKGKCEKFNQSVDIFLRELSLEPVSTLIELNRKFNVWLEEGYTHKPHESLTKEIVDPTTGEIVKDGLLTPYQAYAQDPAKIRYSTGAQCLEAFLWEDTRRVDNTGCVKLKGCVYDIGAKFAKLAVDLRYDPFDISLIEVWHNGEFVRKAARLSVGDWTAAHSAVVSPKGKTPTSSRLLKVYEERSAKRDKARNGALSFYGGDDHDD